MTRVGLALVILAALSLGTARAATPMTLLLGRAQGRGTVVLATPTKGLHGRIWVYRLGGSGVARGRGEVSCASRSSMGTAGETTWFRFAVRPNARAELWRRTGDADCAVTVTLRGSGLLRIELRGY